MRYAKRLRSVANSALRMEIRTANGLLTDPFLIMRPAAPVAIDLKAATLTPESEDSVSEFYMELSKWFRRCIEHEQIPLESIESALVHVEGSTKTCTIVCTKETIQEKRSYRDIQVY